MLHNHDYLLARLLTTQPWLITTLAISFTYNIMITYQDYLPLNQDYLFRNFGLHDYIRLSL